MQKIQYNNFPNFPGLKSTLQYLVTSCPHQMTARTTTSCLLLAKTLNEFVMAATYASPGKQWSIDRQNWYIHPTFLGKILLDRPPRMLHRKFTRFEIFLVYLSTVSSQNKLQQLLRRDSTSPYRTHGFLMTSHDVFMSPIGSSPFEGRKHTISLPNIYPRGLVSCDPRYATCFPPIWNCIWVGITMHHYSLYG